MNATHHSNLQRNPIYAEENELEDQRLSDREETKVSDRNYEQKFTKPQPKPQPAKPTGPINVDDLIIPAILPNAGANQMSEYPDGEDPNQGVSDEVGEISAQNLKVALPLINCFGDLVIRKLFSKTWQHREEALNEIEDLAINGNQIGEEDAFLNSIGAINFTINDKMAVPSQKAINFLSVVCETFPNVQLDGKQA